VCVCACAKESAETYVIITNVCRVCVCVCVRVVKSAKKNKFAETFVLLYEISLMQNIKKFAYNNSI